MTTTYIAPGEATADDDDRVDVARLLRQEPGRRAGGAGQRQLRLRRGGGLPDRERQAHHPLRGATLVGNGIDILLKIDLIAGDFEVKTGMCGKDGQAVPVGTGQATLRISEMTVGGPPDVHLR